LKGQKRYLICVEQYFQKCSSQNLEGLVRSFQEIDQVRTIHGAQGVLSVSVQAHHWSGPGFHPQHHLKENTTFTNTPMCLLLFMLCWQLHK
jgi:hypothetical protein